MNPFRIFNKNYFKKDMFAVLSKETPSFLKGVQDPNSNSIDSNIEILSNYPSGNRIPNLLFIKIMRIPAFLFSAAFFTCIGWISMDQHDTMTGIFRFIKISEPFHISFNYKEMPIWSFGTLLGIFVAVIYNLSVYQRIVKHVIDLYKRDYFVFLSNVLSKIVNDKEEKTVAILSIKDNSASAIFLENKNGEIVPTVINIGTVHEESENIKVFQRYHAIADHDEYNIELRNYFNKTYEIIKIIREGDKIILKKSDDELISELKIEGDRLLVDKNTLPKEEND